MKQLMIRITTFLGFLLLSGFAFAQGQLSTASTGDTYKAAALAIGAGLGIGIAAFGGALGQGKAAAAALEGIARNPEAVSKIRILTIISLALIESLVIYALVITFLLLGKI